MNTGKQLIGIYGGTFDPIHNGHLRIATAILQALNLQGVQFIPNNYPIHRDIPVADAQDRLAMLQIATKNNPAFFVNNIELNRAGPSYTIDTLKQLRKENPSQTLCLLIGEDAFAKINQWHEWESLTDLAHLIIFNRPGVKRPYAPEIESLLQARKTKNIADLRQQDAGFIMQNISDPIDLSATQVREKLKAGKDVLPDIPEEVYDYIKNHQLYSSHK